MLVSKGLDVVLKERPCQLTHDSRDETPEKRPDCNSQEEEAHRDLDKTYGEEIYRLRYKVQLHCLRKVFGVNVFDVSTCAIVDLRYDYALACNTLVHPSASVRGRRVNKHTKTIDKIIV